MDTRDSSASRNSSVGELSKRCAPSSEKDFPNEASINDMATYNRDRKKEKKKKKKKKKHPPKRAIGDLVEFPL